MDLSIVSIFAAGLLTFASPCVLPLVPVYVATLAGGSLEGAKRGRLLLVATAFVAGLSMVFVALGALASTFGGLLLQHRTAVVLSSGVLMAVFGLRALGLFRVALFDRDSRPGLSRISNVSTIAGAFVFGAAFAFGWSPCIGPVLASVLTFAATHADSPWKGAGYLAVYAAGLSLPLLGVALGASHASRWVRRIRGAIPKFEKATGAALVAVGLWTIAGALPARVPVSTAQVEPPRVAVEPISSVPEAPANATCTGDENDHLCGLPAVTESEPGQAAALPTGAPRILEFTARTCAVCQRMLPVLESVMARCGMLDENLVRVDVATPRGRDLATEHAVRGTPTLVLLDHRGIERGRVLGERSERDLLEVLGQAYGAACIATQDSPKTHG